MVLIRVKKTVQNSSEVMEETSDSIPDRRRVSKPNVHFRETVEYEGEEQRTKLRSIEEDDREHGSYHSSCHRRDRIVGGVGHLHYSDRDKVHALDGHRGGRDDRHGTRREYHSSRHDRHADGAPSSPDDRHGARILVGEGMPARKAPLRPEEESAAYTYEIHIRVCQSCQFNDDCRIGRFLADELTSYLRIKNGVVYRREGHTRVPVDLDSGYSYCRKLMAARRRDSDSWDAEHKLKDGHKLAMVNSPKSTSALEADKDAPKAPPKPILKEKPKPNIIVHERPTQPAPETALKTRSDSERL
ncbi:hypothetical protein K470DRAFT_266870 [Piedraia hortae CBS 480.64]|uniref:Uncharacterized protein n=1 Tax=Piedraia hortae CBS 480.64 TaxID=1314780 RepID=A0A6A7BPZ7_9PEZI|nr:hypothetical protein K470DRAFT_266870 [Piedraia hortae CBS 480.64]